MMQWRTGPEMAKRPVNVQLRRDPKWIPEAGSTPLPPTAAGSFPSLSPKTPASTLPQVDSRTGKKKRYISKYKKRRAGFNNHHVRLATRCDLLDFPSCIVSRVIVCIVSSCARCRLSRYNVPGLNWMTYQTGHSQPCMN